MRVQNPRQVHGEQQRCWCATHSSGVTTEMTVTVWQVQLRQTRCGLPLTAMGFPGRLLLVKSCMLQSAGRWQNYSGPTNIWFCISTDCWCFASNRMLRAVAVR